MFLLLPTCSCYHIISFLILVLIQKISFSLFSLSSLFPIFICFLKVIFDIAGVQQEGVLFLVPDNQITDKNEKLFVYINDILNGSYIPDLHSKDEKDVIINKLTTKAKKEGYSSAPSSVWNYYLSKVRQNLHCCLCFSPLGTTLRTRARRFPALANCTVRSRYLFVFICVYLYLFVFFVFICAYFYLFLFIFISHMLFSAGHRLVPAMAGTGTLTHRK